MGPTVGGAREGDKMRRIPGGLVGTSASAFPRSRVFLRSRVYVLKFLRFSASVPAVPLFCGPAFHMSSGHRMFLRNAVAEIERSFHFLFFTCVLATVVNRVQSVGACFFLG